MTLARTRLVVALFGVAVLIAILGGLAVVGGPGTGRRDRRDAARTDSLRQIADALVCHAEAGADPAQPLTLGEISPGCLAPDAARRLVDPGTGAGFPIAYPAADHATICADFEGAAPESRVAGWLPFDAETGCVSVSLTRK